MRILLALVLLLAATGCRVYVTDLPNNNQSPHYTKNNNSCKILQDTVVLYAIFVDSKLTKPWTKYDLKTTLDSINKAARWLEQQARDNGKNITVKVIHPEGKDGMVPIKGELFRRTFSGLMREKGIEYVDKWADKVAMKAHQTLPDEQSPEVATLNKPKDRERLIARLRDIHNTESVALMFFVNNYYQQDLSVTLYSGSKSPTNPMEYAVISFKEPGTIAHEFLHLFGGIDLYYWHQRKYLEEYLGDAVMAFPHQNLTKANMSTITQYLVGWSNELDMCNTLILNSAAGYRQETARRRWLPWRWSSYWKRG